MSMGRQWKRESELLIDGLGKHVSAHAYDSGVNINERDPGRAVPTPLSPLVTVWGQVEEKKWVHVRVPCQTKPLTVHAIIHVLSSSTRT